MLHKGSPHESNEGYSYAKRLLDVHCKLYNNKYGYNFKCIIPTNLYGKYANYSLTDGHAVDNSLFKKYYPEFEFKSFEEGIKDTCNFFKSNYDSVRK